MTELVHLETIAEAPNFGDVIFRRIEPFLGRNVLDVGIGIGIFTGRLLARCEKVAGVELVAEFIDIARRRYAGRNLELIQADMGAALPPALAGRRFDTVLWINVLEHIDDDILALRNSHDLLDPGGRLVLVVPDCPWLFNKLDVYGGHFRRYDKAEIASKLERTGFALEHCKSFNMTGILGWFVNGSILRRKYPPKGHVRMFDRLAPWLDALEAFIGPPFGMSIVVVGRK
ncbi:MAG: class I SAM-dependent methyltransferase [Elusimicrobia bacterium]|nr:class I SAM-dependent methyltransferase [Elusimicrobiota bacterium]